MIKYIERYIINARSVNKLGNRTLFGARYLDAKTSRWMSTDPALSDYIPGAPINDEVKKQNQNLPGMGGVFNYVNMHLYHYAGNNPVKYLDPDGRFQVESPYQKSKSDPKNERGYRISPTNWNIFGNLFGKQVPALLPANVTKSNRSRAESNIPNDRGNFSLDRFYSVSSQFLSGIQDTTELLPLVDLKTMEIYKNLFGGMITENGELIAPKDQSYGQVRNRIDLIFGLLAYGVGEGQDNGIDEAGLIERVNMNRIVYDNIPENERTMIINEVQRVLDSGEFDYEYGHYSYDGN